ncbi:MAG TPA: hypothetical protein VGL71_05325 [Urbifossiella sp.]
MRRSRDAHPMYCVFCGKPDVISCQRCGRWVCPCHWQKWGTRKVCVGCQRRLMRVLAAQLAVFAGAIGLIAFTVYLVMNSR